jgi:hypothetical protein
MCSPQKEHQQNNRKPDRLHAKDRIFHIQDAGALTFATPPRSPRRPLRLLPHQTNLLRNDTIEIDENALNVSWRQLREALAHDKKSSALTIRRTCDHETNRAEVRAGSRQGNSRLYYVAGRKTDARLWIGDSPGRTHGNAVSNRASEFDHRRLQIPPSPLHDPSLTRCASRNARRCIVRWWLDTGHQSALVLGREPHSGRLEPAFIVKLGHGLIRNPL